MSPTLSTTRSHAHPCEIQVEVSNENQELYVLGGNELFVFDAGTSAPIDVDDSTSGIQGAQLGTAVGQLALGPQGKFAFVLHGSHALGVVQVQKTGVTPAQRFATYQSVSTVPGVVLDLAVEPIAGTSDFAVYIASSCTTCAPLGPPTSCSSGGASSSSSSMFPSSSSSCVPPSCTIEPCPGGGFPDANGNCGGGGGGGGGDPVTSKRDVALAVRILRPNFDGGGPLLDPNNPWTVVCESDIELSRVDVNLVDEPWPRVGLDVNTSGSELFIVNPETDSLFVLNTSTNQLEVDAFGVPVEIAVGIDPFDVEILNVLAGGVLQDRAYVANHGDTNVWRKMTL